MHGQILSGLLLAQTYTVTESYAHFVDLTLCYAPSLCTVIVVVYWLELDTLVACAVMFIFVHTK